MNEQDIQSLLESSIPDSQVQAQIDGSHVHLVVVSPAFEGLMPVKKQQLVYACLQDSISSGAIHAVHMQTYTPAQWAEKQA